MNNSMKTYALTKAASTAAPSFTQQAFAGTSSFTKSIFSVVLALILIAGSFVFCFAGIEKMNNPSLPRIVDEADLFTSSEEEKIQAGIDRLLDFGLDFVVYTTNSSQGKSDMALADDFYDYNGYGTGSKNSGCVLCICMEQGNRFWWLSCCGDAEAFFTEYNINVIDNMFYDYMAGGKYGQGVEKYLSYVNDLYTNGVNVWEIDPEFSVDPKAKLFNALGIGGGLGLVAGAVSLFTAMASMKTVSKSRTARNYLDRNSFNLSIARDLFLYRSVNRTKIQQQSSNSGGRSSYSGGHRSSSGSHHSGGGRHF